MNENENRSYFEEERDAELQKWQDKFESKIPPDWNVWYNITETFETAEEQLDDELINAAITHPNVNILESVAKTQKLTIVQLKVIFSRRDVAYHRRQEIIELQAAHGMTLNELGEVTGKSISELLNPATI